MYSFTIGKLSRVTVQASWMERYLQQHHGQVAGALVKYCYVLWMTWRSMWPSYWLFWHKLWAVEVNGLLS